MITMEVTLTGISHTNGTCDCCGRTLGRVFELSDGGSYGRTCAAKITGWKLTDQALRMAAKAAQVKAERIAAGWTATNFVSYARESEGCINDRMVYVAGKPHVLDWAEQAASDLYA